MSSASGTGGRIASERLKSSLRNRYDAYNEGGQKEKVKAALKDPVAAAPGREAAVRVFNLGAAASRVEDMDTALARLTQAIELDSSLEQGYSALEGISRASSTRKRRQWPSVTSRPTPTAWRR